MLNDDFLRFHEVMAEASAEAGRELWDRLCSGDEKAMMKVGMAVIAVTTGPILASLAPELTAPPTER